MIEFALVLPIFLLLVMGILDFGFLFYNYISLENSARNAARVACVEYEDIAYDSAPGGSGKIVTRVLPIPSEDPTERASYSGLKNAEVPYSESEKDLCIQVAQSLKNTGIDKEDVVVTVEYSYDTSEQVATNGWDLKSRPKGDVTVKVQGKAHVLTPVLGVTADHMKKNLVSSSTFKVEEQVEVPTNN